MKKLKNKGSSEPVQRSGVPSASEENLVRCNLLRQFMLKSYDEYKKKQHKNGSPSDLLLRRENEIDESTRNCSLRGTVYVDHLSNSQCKTIMSNSNDNVYFRNRFVEMISEFGTFLLAELVATLAKAGVDDDVILVFIKKNIRLLKLKTPPTMMPRESVSSSDYKMKQISEIIRKHCPHTMCPKILDVGCGNGSKIRKINRSIPSEIYGADIKSWGPYTAGGSYKFPFQVIVEEPYRIPYDTGMFDCVLLVLTLHHCKKILTTIDECKRLLNKNGIIVLVEHDVWNDYDHMLIDVQHRIYQTLNDEKESQPGNYFTFFEWDYLFAECGMEPEFGTRLTETVSFRIRYDVQFVTVYKQIKR